MKRCAPPTEDLQYRNWRRSSISGWQSCGGYGRGHGHVVHSLTGFYAMPIGLFFYAHGRGLDWFSAGQLDARFAVRPKARSRISAAIESPFLSVMIF
jgi:hypothetical protein